MAGLPALSDTSRGYDRASVAFQELLTQEQRTAYEKALAPLDAVHWIGHAAPAKLLFQFAHRDEYISYVDAAAYLQAASAPKEVKWYDTDHYFNQEARKDRDDWLTAVLHPKP
jgi:hypothetical protein